MAEILEFNKLLGGVEDLLMDATNPPTVEQIRGGKSVDRTKININTIPAEGTYGQDGFKSIKEYIDTNTTENSLIEVVDDEGGIALTAGDAGLDWTNGTPTPEKMSIARKLNDGTYEWMATFDARSTTIGFRGRITGLPALADNHFVVKSQLDTVDNKIKYATEDSAGIIRIATDEEAAQGTDTTKAINARQLKANMSESGIGYAPGAFVSDSFKVARNTFYTNNTDNMTGYLLSIIKSTPALTPMVYRVYSTGSLSEYPIPVYGTGFVFIPLAPNCQFNFSHLDGNDTVQAYVIRG